MVWVWRASERINLLGMYGGVEKFVWFDALAWWLAVVAIAGVCGKGGVIDWVRGRALDKEGECLCETCVKRTRDGEEGEDFEGRGDDVVVEDGERVALLVDEEDSRRVGLERGGRGGGLMRGGKRSARGRKASE